MYYTILLLILYNKMKEMREKYYMKKIIVIGPGESGKSYFSKELSKILNIPVFHLDNIFWNKTKHI